MLRYGSGRFGIARGDHVLRRLFGFWRILPEFFRDVGGGIGLAALVLVQPVLRSGRRQGMIFLIDVDVQLYDGAEILGSVVALAKLEVHFPLGGVVVIADLVQIEIDSS